MERKRRQTWVLDQGVIRFPMLIAYSLALTQDSRRNKAHETLTSAGSLLRRARSWMSKIIEYLSNAMRCRLRGC